MDGEAIVALFGIGCGVDTLKDILPKLGQRIKVYTCLKGAIVQEMR